MQNVSPAFHDAALAKVRKPTIRLEVRWSDAWVDESAHVLEVRLRQEDAELGSDLFSGHAVTTGTILFRNYRRRFSPYATGGDASLRSILATGWGAVGKRVRLDVGFDLGGSYEYCRLFTGVITAMHENADERTITLAVQDDSWRLLQERVYSTMQKEVDITWFLQQAQARGVSIGSVYSAGVPVPRVWLDDDSLWTEMVAFAAAVGGRVWFNAQGELCYATDSRFPLAQKVLTLTASNVMPIAYRVEPDKLASEVVIEYASRRRGRYGVLYTHDRGEIIAPGASLTLELRLQRPADAFIPFDHIDYAIDNGYGLDMRPHVEIGIHYFAQHVFVTLTNTHTSFPAFLRHLQIRGYPLEGAPSTQVRQYTSSTPIRRVRSLRANDYVQTATQAEYLAAIAFDRFSTPGPIFILRDIPGLPHLELYDRIGFYDGRSVGAEREGIVIGIDHVFRVGHGSATVFAQTLSLLDARVFCDTGGETPFRFGMTPLGAGVCWY